MTQRIVQNKSIGGSLRRLRQKSGLKQRQVAEKLQLMGEPMSREIYAQIEMGRHHIPITVLMGLKKIYGVSWDEMLVLDERSAEDSGK